MDILSILAVALSLPPDSLVIVPVPITPHVQLVGMRSLNAQTRVVQIHTHSTLESERAGGPTFSHYFALIAACRGKAPTSCQTLLYRVADDGMYYIPTEDL